MRIFATALICAAFGAAPAWCQTWEEAVPSPPDTADINEGELNFLSGAPPAGVHIHRNRIEITDRSLATGWVALSQCHVNLDPVPATEIVFAPDRIRGIRVTASRNIHAAKTGAASVQLEGVGREALVCLEAETRALRQVDENRYSLRNGPYMRRFLDGFFPLRLEVTVTHPRHMRPLAFRPGAQPGMAIDTSPGRIEIDALFEGKLVTEIEFVIENP